LDLELIKKGILKEVKNQVNTIDPAINVEYCVGILLKVLKYRLNNTIKDDLSGLENSILSSFSSVYVDKKITDEIVGNFCKNFEQIIKKIYYILSEGEFITDKNSVDQSTLQALGPYLSSLNKVRVIYLNKNDEEVEDIEEAHFIEGNPNLKINPNTGLPQFIRLYSSSITLDKYSSLKDVDLDEKLTNKFVGYFIKSLILKNEQSHQVPERGNLENAINYNITLTSIIWIINFFKKELHISFRKESLRNFDLEEYITSEIERLKNSSQKFVSLGLKELTPESHQKRTGLIDEIINSGISRLRILGQGGSGKTTTLEHLFYKDANIWRNSPSNSKLPILVSLTNVPSNETLLNHIAKKIHIGIEFLEELLQTNEVIFYLDGINEIVENRESKKTKLQEIGYLFEEYPNLQIIITDRYEHDSYQSNMFKIPTFLIQKISEDQLESFVKKYCISIEQATHVLSILKTKDNIRQLLLRPLLLTRAIEIIKVENDLPEREGHIIEKFIDILLIREKDEKKDPLLNILTFKLLLSYVANRIWTEHQTNVAIHEFSFNKLLVKASNEFGLEKFNAGYVVRIGCELEILMKNDDHIQFYHQSYLEFFCKHFLKYEFH